MNEILVEDVAKSEWQDWKQSKVTRKLVADILNERLYLSESLLDGRCGNEEERLITIGRCQGIKDVVSYVIAEFKYQEKDHEENLKNGD